MSGRSSDQRRVFLATALATQRERRIAVAFAVASFAAFLAIVPFVRVHYRNVLDTGQCDDAQRRTIERLLAEEEAKLVNAADIHRVRAAVRRHADSVAEDDFGSENRPRA